MGINITIIGDGSMGTVSALLLEGLGNSVTLWGRSPEYIGEMIQTRMNKKYLDGYMLPEGLRLTADPRQAVQNANLIVAAIPTQFLRTTFERFAPFMPPGIPVVSLAKGIENNTLLRPTQVIGDVLRQTALSLSNQNPGQLHPDHPDRPARPVASISGPSVAHELAKGLPATVCVASDDEQLARNLQQTFSTHWFRVYTNNDLLGVELAGATKNVIALAAGILDGLQAGNNAKSALLSRGLAEITRLGVAMGANPQTFYGIAGVGDLATTCFSPTGRNRTCGELLGKGRKLPEVLKTLPGVVEGVPTTRSVVQLSQKYKVEMPITQAVYQVLFEELDPIAAISRLMNRELKRERVQ